MFACMCGGIVEFGIVGGFSAAALVATHIYNRAIRFAIAPGARLQLLKVRKPAHNRRDTSRPAPGARLQVR